MLFTASIFGVLLASDLEATGGTAMSRFQRISCSFFSGIQRAFLKLNDFLAW